MTGPVAAVLSGGRLHLQHGPIDLILGAEGAVARRRAFAAATARFETVLEELVAELPLLRRPVAAGSERPRGVVARRMDAAVRPHAAAGFVTPMAAVAGAVADEVLQAMTAAAPLARAYVNNGGDIALHLAAGQRFCAQIAGLDGGELGRVTLAHGAGIGGIASSGRGGRSLSFGIADSVTVLARDAAADDVAATLIANAVTLGDHEQIRRQPACALDPDSDLGERAVVVAVGALRQDEIDQALEAGRAVAQRMLREGRIAGAALVLRGAARVVGAPLSVSEIPKQGVEHA